MSALRAYFRRGFVAKRNDIYLISKAISSCRSTLTFDYNNKAISSTLGLLFWTIKELNAVSNVTRKVEISPRQKETSIAH